MRRKDREIRDLDQLEDILKECDAVRIAAQDEAGLFIVPMNFGYRLEGEKLTLFVHSAPEGRKVDAFRQDGMVAFEMDCGHALRTADTACGHSFTYRSIMGSGMIRAAHRPGGEEGWTGCGHGAHDRPDLGLPG